MVRPAKPSYTLSNGISSEDKSIMNSEQCCVKTFGLVAEVSYSLIRVPSCECPLSQVSVGRQALGMRGTQRTLSALVDDRPM